MLNDNVSTAEIRGMFRLKQVEVQSLIETEMARLTRIEARLMQIERGGDAMPPHEVLIKRVEPIMVASLIESTGKASIPGLFEEIDDFLRWSGVSSTVPHRVLWHSCMECEESINLEIACPVPYKLHSGAEERRE